MDINYLSQLIHERELYEYKEYIESQKFEDGSTILYNDQILTIVEMVNYDEALAKNNKGEVSNVFLIECENISKNN